LACEDSCAGADSSRAWLDSCAGADSWEDGDSAAACGAWAGGRRTPVVVLLEPVLEALVERPLLLDEVDVSFLPGNALAATSARTPVSATLPARSQRLILLRSRSALSRV